MSAPLSLICAGAIAGGLLLAGPATAAPSFDCAAAAMPIELALCGDAALGDLEGEMTRLYQQRLADADPARVDQLQRDMRRWLGRLTKDCGVPRTGAFDEESIARVSPCLAQRYRAQIAALTPPAPAEPAQADAAAELAAAVEAEAAVQVADEADDFAPAAGPEVAALPPQPAPDAGANPYSWQAAPYGSGLVAIIARIDDADDYATASVYCDGAHDARVPVFLYRLGGPVPAESEVERLNETLQGAELIVDGQTVQSAGRDDLGKDFSGLQLLPDGTLSYMMLIDPAKLEAILHGSQLKAVLQLPEGGGAYAAETFPLKNSRKAIEAAMRSCISAAASAG